MAVPKGIIRFSGTIDGISFYETKYGWVVRRKGGPNPSAMKKDARFARVRENGKEFGACGKASGWLRKALYPFLKEAGDGRMIGRLTKVFLQIKNLDLDSKRGKRSVNIALQSIEGQKLLQGFDFNVDAPVRNLVKAPYTLNADNGEIRFKGMNLKKDVKAPKGSTHVTFRSIFVRIDFNKGVFEMQESAVKRISLSSASSSFVLQPQALVMTSGVCITVLQICFYQALNGKDYRLQNTAFNGMSVLAVGNATINA